MGAPQEQKAVEVTLATLASIQQGGGPKASVANGGPFYASMIRRLANFVMFRAVRGQAALQELWNEIETRMEDDDEQGKVGLSDLEVFSTNRWMLREAQVPVLTPWVKSVCKAADGTGAAPASASASSSALVPVAKRRQKAATAQHLMQLCLKSLGSCIMD
mmetsp:Transcript_159259/g.487299  ORF Transcript_159259/g.487299 Transcript_159259/m.487299 type:complete len:161 (+) Transcript_159259:88-570(+)